MPIVPMLMAATAALTMVYVLLPAPAQVGKRELQILSGETPRPTLLDRLRGMPGKVKGQFVGLGSQEQVGGIALLRLASAGLGGPLGATAGYVFAPTVPRLIPMAIFALACYFLPEYLHKRRREARRERVEKEMVFFLASLRSFCSFGNLYQALELALIGEEGLLADELRRAVGRMALGGNAFESLHECAERLDTPEFTGLVDILEQAEAVGAPLEEAVAAVEKGIYERWESQAQAEVARMDFRLTVLGVLVLMPALILVAVLPALMQIARQFR